MRTVRLSVIAAVAVATAIAGCSAGTQHRAESRPITPSAPPTSASSTPSAGDSAVVWLCRPGATPDPCLADEASTAIEPDDSRHPDPAPAATSPRADCFYVYPTVSGESGANADLRIENSERAVAFAQASRFSSACDVWAPMYRQRTISDLFNLADDQVDSVANHRALASLRTGWQAFLRLHNPRRPIVLIGHSQGAAMLIRLIRGDIDPDAVVRRQIALAVLLGGNVTVKSGSLAGGSFKHLPLCSRRGQSGCVIAYSSFPKEPPVGAFFGRPGSGVSTLAGETASHGLQVACVNPVDPAGGKRVLLPYVPTTTVENGAPTRWTSYPNRVTAQCRTAHGATWLEVRATAATRGRTQFLKESLGALWGFHVADVNLALGDLVTDVALAAKSWHG